MAEYEPLLIERAQGCTLVDVAGREYIDGVSSLWCNIHGHRHPRIDTAIRRQLDEVAHITLLGMAHPTTVRLARRLVRLSEDNEAEAGKWFLEAGFGRVDDLSSPTFADLNEAQGWISNQLS